jgi:hypothetical protein
MLCKVVESLERTAWINPARASLDEAKVFCPGPCASRLVAVSVVMAI